MIMPLKPILPKLTCRECGEEIFPGGFLGTGLCRPCYVAAYVEEYKTPLCPAHFAQKIAGLLDYQQARQTEDDEQCVACRVEDLP